MEEKLDGTLKVTEMLIKISNDLSVVKNEIQNIKDDYVKDNKAMKERISFLEQDVGDLKKKDLKQDATRYRQIVQFICTALGGMVVAKFPEIIHAVVRIFK